MRHPFRRWTPALPVLFSLVATVSGCGQSSNDGAAAPSSPATTTTATAPVTATSTVTPGTPGAGGPTTGPKHAGAGDRNGPAPTISSYTVTPEEAPCRDGKVQATMSWTVTPPEAQAWIGDGGIGFEGGSNDVAYGPFPAQMRDEPVPPWVRCDGRPYNLDIQAQIPGSARFAAIAGQSVRGTP